MEFNHVRQFAAQQSPVLLQRFQRVVKRGIFLDGPEVHELEAKLAKLAKVEHVLAVASGHDALLLSLQALNLPPNAEVLCPVNAYPSAFPIVQAGYKLKGVDCDANGLVSLATLKNAVTAQTKALVLVYLYGLVPELAEMLSFCRQHKIIVIEDCAQAFGATYKGQLVGTFGDVGCFSFYPTKNLGALGDGGAIFTNSAALAAQVAKLRSYGESERYHSTAIAGHSRLPELQAAGLNVYLKSFEKQRKARQKVKQFYVQELARRGIDKDVRVLQSSVLEQEAPHLLVVAVSRRDELQKYLAAHKIPTLIHYPQPLQLVKAFKNNFEKSVYFSESEKLATQILSLPFSPFLTKKEVQSVCQKIETFYET